MLEFVSANPTLELPLGTQPPYFWVQEYAALEVQVERDQGRGLPYVSLGPHRVYFPRDATAAQITECVRLAKMEQDPRSPHCYVTAGFGPDRGDIGVFVGASDGIFCLSILDRLSKAILFEPNPAWVEPLLATFAQFSDQVEVVPIALGSNDAPGTIKLDSFLRARPEPNYIQIDVDGAEWDVLRGARETIAKARKLRLSVCTYHRRLDYRRFGAFLRRYGYQLGHSHGFYLMGVRMPYLRRGVLYAWRGT
ncbi:MAG: FkbM family methyltransferase [Verrucomicrobiales bacterium]|nr:FkbM family methyltransferase [Verrucomicrobiales bacterium]